MKKLVLVWITVVTTGAALQAQSTDLIRVRPGDDLRKAIPFAKRYKYDPYLGGRALYANGKSSALFRFNYDFLLGEMRLINRMRDTVYVLNDFAIKYVMIGQDIYYHNYRRGYFQLLAEAHTVRLASQQLLKKKRRETSVNNGYGGNFNDYTSAVFTLGLDDILLERRTTMYLIDDDDTIWKANRSNLFKVFPMFRPALKSYIEAMQVDFRKESDMTRLFEYCSGLH